MVVNAGRSKKWKHAAHLVHEEELYLGQNLPMASPERKLSWVSEDVDRHAPITRQTIPFFALPNVKGRCEIKREPHCGNSEWMELVHSLVRGKDSYMIVALFASPHAPLPN